MPGWRGVHLLYLGGAKGGATVGLYQNGGYDESLSMRILSCVINVINVYCELCKKVTLNPLHRINTRVSWMVLV